MVTNKKPDKQSEHQAAEDRRGQSRFGGDSGRSHRDVLPHREPRPKDTGVVALLLGGDPETLRQPVEDNQASVASSVAAPVSVSPSLPQAPQENTPPPLAPKVKPPRSTSLPSRPTVSVRADSLGRMDSSTLGSGAFRVDVEDQSPAWQEFLRNWSRFTQIKGKKLIIIKFIFDRTVAVNRQECITSSGEIYKVCEFKHRNHVFTLLKELVELGFLEKTGLDTHKKHEGLLIRFYPDAGFRSDAGSKQVK